MTTNPERGPMAISEFCRRLDPLGSCEAYLNAEHHKVNTFSSKSHTGARNLIRDALARDAALQAWAFNPGTGMAILRHIRGYAAFSVRYTGFPVARGRGEHFLWLRIPNEDALSLIREQEWQRRYWESGNSYPRFSRREHLGSSPWRGPDDRRLSVERLADGRLFVCRETRHHAERQRLDESELRIALSGNATDENSTLVRALPLSAYAALMTWRVDEALAEHEIPHFGSPTPF